MMFITRPEGKTNPQNSTAGEHEDKHQDHGQVCGAATLVQEKAEGGVRASDGPVEWEDRVG